jgi:hypothetical protein
LARLKYALIAAVLLPILGLAAVACDDDNSNSADGSSNASQQSVDELSLKVQRNEEMQALLTLSGLGLHGMDESLAAGTIDTTFRGKARTAIRVLALTDWEQQFSGDAATLQGHATDLYKALGDEDVEKAATAAHELHEAEHDFDDAVWAVLAAELPADAGGVEEEHEADETPEAGSTPADDHGNNSETPEAEATPVS